MTDEERKHYFGVLVENLYSQVKAIINESNWEDKEDRAKKLINDFYEYNKEEYNINSIEEVIKELDRVDKDIKKNSNKEHEER